jgi:hypothetical protein
LGRLTRARSQWHVTANEAGAHGLSEDRLRIDTHQDTPPSAFRV